jgi:hypothetical protein
MLLYLLHRKKCKKVAQAHPNQVQFKYIQSRLVKDSFQARKKQTKTLSLFTIILQMFKTYG